MTFGIMHMYTLFNRLDPDRHDMYYLYDGLVEQLERLGGPGELAVMDFGSGMGQTGLSFAVAGYDTVFVDVVDAVPRLRPLPGAASATWSRRSCSRPASRTSTTPRPTTTAATG